MLWLDGIVPAWTSLEFGSFCQLRHEPSEPDFAVNFSASATSPIAVNAMRFLNRLRGGIKLTATGNLTRAFVAEMVEALDWPGFDPEVDFRLHKVVNEPDFPALHAIRIFCDRAKLVRTYKGELRLTKSAKKILADNDVGELHRQLFLAAFWNTNLAYFDGLPLAPWPQAGIGLSLWCLSVAAHQWQTPSHLVRLSVVPVNGVLQASNDRDLGAAIFESRFLRTLWWFGLLEVEETPDPQFSFIKLRRYRKSPTFDEFLSFSVQLEGAENGLQ